MQKRLFDRDPQLGITKYWHVKDNGEFVVETVQDMTGIAEYNKRAYNDDPVAFRKWMNDSDNQVFRTRQGVL